MLPAAGILLTERLYIGINITTLADETYSLYATNNDGKLICSILDGRNSGFTMKLGTATYTGNGNSVSFTGLNGPQDYTIELKDIATKRIHTCTCHIGYNGSGSYITYNGINYTAGQSFHFNVVD
jgi:hypothetical protein